MKKLVYISSYSFTDVDFPIIKELKRYFDLYYVVIFARHKSHLHTPKEVADYCNKNGIGFKIFTRENRGRSPGGFLFDYRVVKAIKHSNPDVVYLETSGVYLPFLSRLFLGTKSIVVAIHDIVLHKGAWLFFEAIHNELIFKIFNNIHVFSKTQRDILAAKYPRKKIFFAPLALKNFGQVNYRDEDSERDRKRNFLFFGSIRYNKGLEFLIKAANKLAREYCDFKVTIAGSCRQFDYYRHLIEEPERFDLKIRIIPTSEVPALFADADFLVLPYRDVTQSGCLLTAYNYNVPVIASDFPGFREYVTDGEQGLIFEPENDEALLKCMKKVMQMSREQIYQMKVNVAQFVEKEINLDSIVDKYVEFLSKVAL